MTPLKGGPFHRPCLWRTPPTPQPSRRFLGNIRHGQFDRQPRGRSAPIRQGKRLPFPAPPPKFPISQCAGRQTGVTYQRDIVQQRFSCLPQSNENFNSMLCFFYSCFHRRLRLNTDACTLTHTGGREKE